MSIFSKVQTPKHKSNTFDLSHDRKMSMNMGELTPILALEIVPGDSINMSTSQLLRFAPMIAPVMHQISVYTHFYFVPNRLVWPNWQDFITGGEDGLDATVFPTVEYESDGTVGTLADYLGLPTQNMANEINVSGIPFAAYQKIYNEYYRDQNLIDPVPEALTDGNTNDIADFNLIRKRAWQHDYFTSALPWTQKGAEATIPLGTTAEIIYNNDLPPNYLASKVRTQSGGLAGETPPETLKYDSFGNVYSDPEGSVAIDNSMNLLADLSNATAATINDLRNAFKLQEWLEKNARGGSRYIESILSHFGVRSSDARLQRPEFLGGGSTPVTVSEVLQTSNNDTQETPQGNMAGHGITVGANNSFTYRAEEHGYIIGIMSIMPKTAYQEGIPRHFKKFDKFDYYWPSFAHLGEQPIYNYELWATSDGTKDDEVFGYTPRYAEYKYMNSSVHGEFKTTLDFWHMGRTFETQPYLNQEFIECKPTDRIFAVLDSEKIYAHLYHRIKARRLMPFFGTPRL